MNASPKHGGENAVPFLIPRTNDAGGVMDFFAAVGAAAANIAVNSLRPGCLYVFSSSTDCWISQGNATAAKAAGSMFVAKGVEVVIDGTNGPFLSTLQDAAGGNASLTLIE